MLSDKPADRVFHEGDRVVLAEGTYQGDMGVFVRLRDDVKWAEIVERDGSVRSHPVAWLRLLHGADPQRPEVMQAGPKAA
jgi:hypothetical protein